MRNIISKVPTIKIDDYDDVKFQKYFGVTKSLFLEYFGEVSQESISNILYIILATKNIKLISDCTYLVSTFENNGGVSHNNTLIAHFCFEFCKEFHREYLKKEKSHGGLYYILRDIEIEFEKSSRILQIYIVINSVTLKLESIYHLKDISDSSGNNQRIKNANGKFRFEHPTPPKEVIAISTSKFIQLDKLIIPSDAQGFISLELDKSRIKDLLFFIYMFDNRYLINNDGNSADNSNNPKVFSNLDTKFLSEFNYKAIFNEVNCQDSSIAQRIANVQFIDIPESEDLLDISNKLYFHLFGFLNKYSSDTGDNFTDSSDNEEDNGNSNSNSNSNNKSSFNSLKSQDDPISELYDFVLGFSKPLYKYLKQITTIHGNDLNSYSASLLNLGRIMLSILNSAVEQFKASLQVYKHINSFLEKPIVSSLFQMYITSLGDKINSLPDGHNEDIDLIKRIFNQNPEKYYCKCGKAKYAVCVDCNVPNLCLDCFFKDHNGHKISREIEYTPNTTIFKNLLVDIGISLNDSDINVNQIRSSRSRGNNSRGNSNNNNNSSNNSSSRSINSRSRGNRANNYNEGGNDDIQDNSGGVLNDQNTLNLNSSGNNDEVNSQEKPKRSRSKRDKDDSNNNQNSLDNSNSGVNDEFNNDNQNKSKRSRSKKDDSPINLISNSTITTRSRNKRNRLNNEDNEVTNNNDNNSINNNNSNNSINNNSNSNGNNNNNNNNNINNNNSNNKNKDNSNNKPFEDIKVKQEPEDDHHISIKSNNNSLNINSIINNDSFSNNSFESDLFSSSIDSDHGFNRYRSNDFRHEKRRPFQQNQPPSTTSSLSTISFSSSPPFSSSISSTFSSASSQSTYESDIFNSTSNNNKSGFYISNSNNIINSSNNNNK